MQPLRITPGARASRFVRAGQPVPCPIFAENGQRRMAFYLDAAKLGVAACWLCF